MAKRMLLVDVLSVARHEAGHYLIARHLKTSPVLVLGRRVPAEIGPDDRLISGRVTHARCSAFEACQIGWAGLIVEWREDRPDDAEQLVFEGLEGFDVADFNETLSETDRASITGHCQRGRALELAARIIFENWNEWEAIVAAARRAFVELGADQFVYPIPEKEGGKT